MGGEDADNERLLRDETAGNLSDGSARFLGELLTSRVSSEFGLLLEDETGAPLEGVGGFVQSVNLDGQPDNKIDCPTECLASYQLGEVVRLKVNDELLALEGYTFLGWEGYQCGNYGDQRELEYFLDFQIGNQCTARFQRVDGLLLGVEKIVEDGLVNSDDGLIVCLLGCNAASAVYEEPTTVTLTAEGDPGVSDFVSWAGAGCQGSDPNVTIDVSENRHCEVAFENVGSATRTLVVQIHEDGDGDGDVLATGIDCPDVSCQEHYPIDSIVVLSAYPAEGSEFGGWSGNGCDPQAGNPHNAQVLMSTTRICTARFDVYHPDRRLDALKTGTGAGEIESDAPGPFIDCDAGCSSDFAIYEHGRAVRLHATPIAGQSTFSGWTGDGCQSSQTFVDVQMTDDRECTAEFVAADPVTLTVSVVATNGLGEPEVAVDPGNLIVTGTDSFGFGEGTAITLAAATDGNYEFQRWLGVSCPFAGEEGAVIQFAMPGEPIQCAAMFRCPGTPGECSGGE